MPILRELPPATSDVPTAVSWVDRNLRYIEQFGRRVDEVLFDVDGGLLAGEADSFSLGTGTDIIQGYEFARAVGDVVVVPETGTISIFETGWYRVNLWVFGTQGNDAKEEAIRCMLRISNTAAQDGDYVLDVFDVATDKTTERCFNAGILRFFEPGAQLQIAMNATAGMGTFTVVNTSFDVIEIGEQQRGDADPGI